jgi:hypothetical protein
MSDLQGIWWSPTRVFDYMHLTKYFGRHFQRPAKVGLPGSRSFEDNFNNPCRFSWIMFCFKSLVLSSPVSTDVLMTWP